MRRVRDSLLTIALLSVAPPAAGQFASLGAPANEMLAGEPSCLSWPGTNGRLQCYVRGASGTLWQIRSEDSVGFPAGWKPLGGVLWSDPSCVSGSPSQVACFAYFQDALLWRTTSNDAGVTFSGWARVAREDFAGKPSCIVAGPSRVDCFGIGTDRNVYRVQVSGSSVGNNQLGSGPFFVDPASGPQSMRGPVCVAIVGNTVAARCFASRPDGSFWTVQAGTNEGVLHAKAWSEIPILRGRLSTLDCFSWPGGRVDCFGSSVPSVINHLSNVRVPPGSMTARVEQSGGFFLTAQAAPVHEWPVRCVRSATSAEVDCLVVAPPNAVTEGPLKMWRLRFNRDNPASLQDAEDLGGDLRSVPSCVWVSEVRAGSPTPVPVDTACFARGSGGDLVARRLNSPVPPSTIVPINPPDTLTPRNPITPPR